jgi:ABC-2 type transport system permease protein
VTRLFRTMTLGWVLHFKQESRNPFFLFIVICTPVIYATMAYFLFRRGQEPTTLVAAAVGSALMGIWSLTTTAAAAALQRQRRLGILELLVASPTPFWATFLPITIAIATIGIYSLGTGLLYVRLLFGVPVSVQDWPAFIVAIPPTILSIGLLGFLMGSAFVRFRSAWMIGNLFEFPVWTICGFLIPLALLPNWVEPVAWALAPTWGMNALRNAALGGSAWPDIAMCTVLSVVYALIGGLLLKAFLRLARERATLGLT